MEHQVELVDYNSTPMKKKGDSQWFINSIDEGRWGKERYQYKLHISNVQPAAHIGDWASSTPLRAWIEQKGMRRSSRLSLLDPGHIVFSCLLTLEFEFLGPLDSDQDLHHQNPNSWAIRIALNYTINFPGSLDCTRQVVGLLRLQDHMR